MKTVLFYSGRSAGSVKRDRGDLHDRSAGDRARLDAFFRRANILALLGAAFCVSFFVLCTAQSDRTPTGIEVPGAIGDPDAVVAVMVSANERPAPNAPVDAERDSAAERDTAAETAVESPSGTDTSVWSRLEALLPPHNPP